MAHKYQKSTKLKNTLSKIFAATLYVICNNSALYREHNVNLQKLHQLTHYGDVVMGAIASQITSLTIVYSTVYSDADQRKHQSSASLSFVRGIHRGPVNSPHKWPVTRKMFPFDDVIMEFTSSYVTESSHQLHSYKWNQIFVSIILLKQVRHK